MGVVYEAVEESLGRTVALKLVAPERAGEPGFRERFIAESRLAAVDRPPERAAGLRGGRGGRALWLSMRLVDGSDLRSLAPLAPHAGRARSSRQVGEALDAVHAHRLVHRDVKPANVLLTPLRPRVPDRLRDREGARRDRRADPAPAPVVGTLDYVAPERIRGADDGPAADLYSLGCVLYFALTGRVLFDARGRRAQAVGASVRAAAVGRSGLRGGARPRAGQGPGASAPRAARRSARPRWPRRAACGRRACSTPRRALRERGSPRAARGARRGSAPPTPLAALEHAAARARLIERGADRHPPEQVERRLAEVRGGCRSRQGASSSPAGPQLAVQRRMQAALAALEAEIERLLVELETVRAAARWPTTPPPPHASARCRTRSPRSPSGSPRAGGESTT